MEMMRSSMQDTLENINIIRTTTKTLEIMLKNNNKVWRPALPNGKVFYLLNYDKQIRRHASIKKKNDQQNRRQNQETDLDIYKNLIQGQVDITNELGKRELTIKL